MNTKTIIKEWSDKGTQLEVPGTASTRIWRQGTGPTIVCLHGIPTSAYLYRKILPELAKNGFEGIAMDFPGLGFSERPKDFDYTWTDLSGWLEKALNAAKIDNFHLVLHDLGGPIGFDLIRRIPGRIPSLTVLNTFVNASRFKKPMVMRPFSVPILGKLWTMQMNSPGIVPFFRWKGVLKGPGYSEIRAYGKILSMGDGGSAFRKIMANFETTIEFEERVLKPLSERKFPAQVIWGKHDSELSVDSFGLDVKNALNLKTEIHQVEAKHFLQEDCPEEIAERIVLLIETGKDI